MYVHFSHHTYPRHYPFIINWQTCILDYLESDCLVILIHRTPYQIIYEDDYLGVNVRIDSLKS